MPYAPLDTVIAFPTDTVYGLGIPVGCDPTPIYDLKNRPREKALIELHPDLTSIPIPEALRPLAEHFWPGPLTLIIGGVGYRIPNHPVALSLLNQFGPLLTTSANISGSEPALSAAEVKLAFPLIPIYEGDEGVHGTPSTIIDESGKILRQGVIPKSALQERLGQTARVE